MAVGGEVLSEQMTTSCVPFCCFFGIWRFPFWCHLISHIVSIPWFPRSTRAELHLFIVGTYCLRFCQRYTLPTWPSQRDNVPELGNKRLGAPNPGHQGLSNRVWMLLFKNWTSSAKLVYGSYNGVCFLKNPLVSVAHFLYSFFAMNVLVLFVCVCLGPGALVARASGLHWGTFWTASFGCVTSR